MQDDTVVVEIFANGTADTMFSFCQKGLAANYEYKLQETFSVLFKRTDISFPIKEALAYQLINRCKAFSRDYHGECCDASDNVAEILQLFTLLPFSQRMNT